MTRTHRPRGALLTAFVLVAAFAAAQKYPTISYKEARDHVGEIAWVEGTILRTERAAEGMYLLFSSDDEYVRVLVPTPNLGNFEGSIQHQYTGKKIKAIGKITEYGYKLIVGVNEPKRIQIVDDETG